MRLTYIFVSACLAGLLVGCSQPASEQSASNSTTPPPSTGPVASNNQPETTPPNKGPLATNPATTEAPKANSTAKPPTNVAPSKPSAPETKKAPAIAASDLQWHPSTVTLKEIAKQTDDMIRSLKNVQLDVQYSMNMAAGRGSGHLVEKIKDSKTFMLQYPSVVNDKKRGTILALTLAHGDGKDVTELTGENLKTRPVGANASAPQNLAATWPLIGNREIFAGLLENRAPFQDYVAALSDPKSKYKTTIMERKFPYQGRTYRQYQILGAQGGPAAISGSSSVSMIIDANIHLPVTINVTTIRPGDSRPNTLQWEGKWQNNVTFKPTDFHKLVAPQPTKKPAPTIKT